MACNRHQRREGGRVVPVLEGLAKDVDCEARKLGNVSAVGFRFISKHNGKSKLRIEDPISCPTQLHVTVCDNAFGKSLVIISTPDPATAARELRQRFSKRGVMVT